MAGEGAGADSTAQLSMVFAAPQTVGSPWRGTWELVGLEQ